MDEISVSEARKLLPELLNEVNYNAKRFMITKRGKQVAAIVSIEDVKTLKMLASLAEKGGS